MGEQPPAVGFKDPHGPQYPMTDQPQPGYPPAQPGYPPAQPGYPPPAQGGQPQQPPSGFPPEGGAPQAPPGAAGGKPGGQWMERPQGVATNCPPGLEYLTKVDQLLVQQQVELLEAFTGWETSNKYVVKNSMGQQVFFAAEESNACARQCCGSQRAFTMHITDNMGQEVIRVGRPFKCCAGTNCCAFSSCCAMEIEVEAPVGTTAGYIRQSCSCLAPKYHLLDAQENEILNIEGPICMCQGPCCTWDQEFEVTSSDGNHKLGKISKQWTGLVKEMFTDADNFGVSFPMDLDVRLKATLVGAVFLIDFMFFEQKQKKDDH